MIAPLRISPLAVVTGGTGVVGAPLLDRLVRDLPDHEFLLLTRRPECVRAARVTPVFAELTHAGLSLGPSFRALIQNRADLIIHCAAETQFNLPLAQALLVNTHGTTNILDLAAECPRLSQFAHISTLYVAGRRPGLVTESPLTHEFGYCNTYEESKHQAEQLVLARSAQLPVAIYRLSAVVDGAGGNGPLRHLIRFIPHGGSLRFFPADPKVPVDLITAEWAARALSVLIAHHFKPGAIRHICAGPAALPFGTIMDAAFQACETMTGSAFPRPALVSLSGFEGLSRDGRYARIMEHLMTFIPHFSIAQPFDCAITAKLLAISRVPRPDPRALLQRVFENEFPRAKVPA